MTLSKINCKYNGSNLNNIYEYQIIIKMFKKHTLYYYIK